MTSTFEPTACTQHIWRRRPDGPGLLLEGVPGELQTAVARNLETLDEFPAYLAPLEADLLDIATAVFGTDRMAPRPKAFAKQQGAHFLDWRRDLTVQVPVRHPTHWSAPAVRDTLESTLLELTDDRWHLDFVESTPPPRRATQLRLQASEEGRPVALFSGGLDSLAGALLFRTEHGHLPWLVSIASNSHAKRQQAHLVALMRQQLSEAPEHLVFQIHNTGAEPRDQAKRQRARSFFYFVVAALVARRIRSTDVLVLENGVTSLNVPISPILASTRATRTTHPLVLLAFEKMVRIALEWPEFRMIAPYQLATKGEMTAAISDAPSLIAATVSCARVRTGQWCGTCTACLLRRQVLHVAGLAGIDRDERARYGCDIFDDFDNTSVAATRRWYLLATLDQVFRLLGGSDALSNEPSLLRAAVAAANRAGTTAEAEMQGLVGLHVRYANEWRNTLNQLSDRYPKLRALHEALSLQAG